MIFLLFMSLLAMSIYLGASTGLRIVGQQQIRQEALAAAQVAIEQAISDAGFTRNPAQAASAAAAIDIAGIRYSVQLTPAPRCFRVSVIKNSELDPSNAQDRTCIRSGFLQMPGMELASDQATGQIADPSMCANTDWNLRAQVVDTRSGTSVAVHQGMTLRMLESDASMLCP
jgi:hypothetical protein